MQQILNTMNCFVFFRNDGEREKAMKELRKEYLLRNPNSFTIDNVFPSLDEILSKFSTIRDKSHRDCHSLFTKAVKSVINTKNKQIANKADKIVFNKRFYTQLSYNYLFDILSFSFTLVNQHKMYIYDSIAQLLNTKLATTDDLSSNKDNSSESDAKSPEQGRATSNRSAKENEMLEYLFHKYLMNHHETVFTDKNKNDIIDKVLSKYIPQNEDNSKDSSFAEIWCQFDELRFFFTGVCIVMLISV